MIKQINKKNDQTKNYQTQIRSMKQKIINKKYLKLPIF